MAEPFDSAILVFYKSNALFISFPVSEAMLFLKV